MHIKVSKWQSHLCAESQLQHNERLASSHSMQAPTRLQPQDLLAPRIRQHPDTHRARRLQCRLSAYQDVLDPHQFRQRLGQRLQTPGHHKHAMLDWGATQRTLPVARQDLATNERTRLFIIIISIETNTRFEARGRNLIIKTPILPPKTKKIYLLYTIQIFLINKII